ncbi:hypothetical protein KIPB_005924 [Kipferlia bialata]|uniref:Uncharacterized protein n=1 Tax=Kipferlia bialata TaxID=797122 RepID=A0A391NWE3_9EUKA|nr:hypothetical protein KIPB_005924 [Kipferlia bialata]|eukprot:g5924.t1
MPQYTVVTDADREREREAERERQAEVDQIINAPHVASTAEMDMGALNRGEREGERGREGQLSMADMAPPSRPLDRVQGGAERDLPRDVPSTQRERDRDSYRRQRPAPTPLTMYLEADQPAYPSRGRDRGRQRERESSRTQSRLPSVPMVPVSMPADRQTDRHHPQRQGRGDRHYASGQVAEERNVFAQSCLGSAPSLRRASHSQLSSAVERQRSRNPNGGVPETMGREEYPAENRGVTSRHSPYGGSGYGSTFGSGSMTGSRMGSRGGSNGDLSASLVTDTPRSARGKGPLPKQRFGVVPSRGRGNAPRPSASLYSGL